MVAQPAAFAAVQGFLQRRLGGGVPAERGVVHLPDHVHRAEHGVGDGIGRLQIRHGEIAVRGKFGEPGFGCFDIGPVDFIPVGIMGIQELGDHQDLEPRRRRLSSGDGSRRGDGSRHGGENRCGGEDRGGKGHREILLVSSETLSEDTTQDPACSSFSVDSHTGLIHTAIEKAVHRPANTGCRVSTRAHRPRSGASAAVTSADAILATCFPLASCAQEGPCFTARASLSKCKALISAHRDGGI